MYTKPFSLFSNHFVSNFHDELESSGSNSSGSQEKDTDQTKPEASDQWIRFVSGHIGASTTISAQIETENENAYNWNSLPERPPMQQNSEDEMQWDSFFAPAISAEENMELDRYLSLLAESQYEDDFEVTLISSDKQLFSLSFQRLRLLGPCICKFFTNKRSTASTSKQMEIQISASTLNKIVLATLSPSKEKFLKDLEVQSFEIEELFELYRFADYFNVSCLREFAKKKLRSDEIIQNVSDEWVKQEWQKYRSGEQRDPLSDKLSLDVLLHYHLYKKAFEAAASCLEIFFSSFDEIEFHEWLLLVPIKKQYLHFFTATILSLGNEGKIENRDLTNDCGKKRKRDSQVFEPKVDLAEVKKSKIANEKGKEKEGPEGEVSQSLNPIVAPSLKSRMRNLGFHVALSVLKNNPLSYLRESSQSQEEGSSFQELLAIFRVASHVKTLQDGLDLLSIISSDKVLNDEYYTNLYSSNNPKLSFREDFFRLCLENFNYRSSSICSVVFQLAFHSLIENNEFDAAALFIEAYTQKVLAMESEVDIRKHIEGKLSIQKIFYILNNTIAYEIYSLKDLNELPNRLRYLLELREVFISKHLINVDSSYLRSLMPSLCKTKCNIKQIKDVFFELEKSKILQIDKDLSRVLSFKRMDLKKTAKKSTDDFDIDSGMEHGTVDKFLLEFINLMRRQNIPQLQKAICEFRVNIVNMQQASGPVKKALSYAIEVFIDSNTRSNIEYFYLFLEEFFLNLNGSEGFGLYLSVGLLLLQRYYNSYAFSSFDKVYQSIKVFLESTPDLHKMSQKYKNSYQKLIEFILFLIQENNNELSFQLAQIVHKNWRKQKSERAVQIYHATILKPVYYIERMLAGDPDEAIKILDTLQLHTSLKLLKKVDALIGDSYLKNERNYSALIKFLKYKKITSDVREIDRKEFFYLVNIAQDRGDEETLRFFNNLPSRSSLPPQESQPLEPTPSDLNAFGYSLYNEQALTDVNYINNGFTNAPQFLAIRIQGQHMILKEGLTIHGQNMILKGYALHARRKGELHTLDLKLNYYQAMFLSIALQDEPMSW